MIEQVIQCSSSCTVTVQIEHQFIPELSIQDATQIAIAILALWALAWLFKPAAKALDGG